MNDLETNVVADESTEADVWTTVEEVVETVETEEVELPAVEIENAPVAE
jgi:hypothetical protein